MTVSTFTNISHVHPSQLDDWLLAQSKSDTTPVLLDVREPWELQLASVQPANCLLVSISMMQLQARLSELAPETPIAILCHHGVRSMQVARFLTNQGFSSVANISGGIAAWANDFDATVAKY